MKTLKLFNAVLKQDTGKPHTAYNAGFVIESDAVWAEKEILAYYRKTRLTGEDLNKTFHKSWVKIEESSRAELLIEQIQHYISTYGSGFKDVVYIPDEVLDLPKTKLKYKVIKALTKDELIKKCIGMLSSGIALQEETIDDIIEVLTDTCDYTFTGGEGIKNKEAIIKIADVYGVLPKDTLEFFRYIVYRTTGDSLLIKNQQTIDAIKASGFNPGPQFKAFGLPALAEHFNRFKPIFLAFKSKCPKVINKISKLSKTKHKPMVQNPLNLATGPKIDWEENKHWLENATIYALIRALSGCYSRMMGQDTFVYRVRNGKTWTTEKGRSNGLVHNYTSIMQFLQEKYSFEGKKFFIPKGVQYGLPTSEKMFVGNIPTGTKFSAESLAVGIYWENKWGARDHDISGINIGGKVGWNSTYSQSGRLMYSGDLTDAKNGAVEYLYANNGLEEPTLVKNNVYSGGSDAGYSIIVGAGDSIDRQYMMNPDNLIASVRTNSVEAQTILGMILPEKKGQSFVLINAGAGSLRVSGTSDLVLKANKALFQQYSNPFSFDTLLEELGGERVETAEEADYDLSVDSLEKDTFIKILEESEKE